MITFGYNCPHCGVENGGFEVKAHYENRRSDYAIFSILAVCNTCNSSIGADIETCDSYLIFSLRDKLTSKKYYNLLEVYQENIQFHPKAAEPEIPEDLPAEVHQKMRAAETLFLQAKGNPDMLEFSATGYRATLEIA